MKFTRLQLMVALSVLLQLASVGLVVFLGYYIYSNGLKALIDTIWMGFTG